MRSVWNVGLFTTGFTIRHELPPIHTNPAKADCTNCSPSIYFGISVMIGHSNGEVFIVNPGKRPNVPISELFNGRERNLIK
jgi:hypothetical protein